jgi:hypothetical protein
MIRLPIITISGSCVRSSIGINIGTMVRYNTMRRTGCRARRPLQTWCAGLPLFGGATMTIRDRHVAELTLMGADGRCCQRNGLCLRLKTV